MPKLLIIDGNSLLFRAYYATAYPGQEIMRTKDGVPTNAVFAFSNMIGKILSGISEETHILVAFDTGKKTFRHQELETYKANRKPVPPDLITQMPIARDFLLSMGVYTYEMDGYEGDDVAGTASVRAAEAGYEVEIYTSDRDFLQLIQPHVEVRLLKHGLSDIARMDEAALLAEYGLKPSQVVDYKGLVGDVSDNIPGVSGIGEKTAVKLIQEYGDLAHILDAAETLGGKLGEKLKNGREIALLSRHLAEIDVHVPLDFALEETRYQGYHFEAINAFCQRYELRMFMNKLPSQVKKEAQEKALLKVDYPSAFLFPDFGTHVGIALDAEGNNYRRASVFGIALSNGKKHYYFPLETLQKDAKLKAFLADPKVRKHAFDYKALRGALEPLGVTLKGLESDVLLAAYLLDSSLNNAPESVFGFFGADISVPEAEGTTVLPQGQPAKTAQIAYQALMLTNKIVAELKKQQAYALYQDIELPLCDVLADMEIEGFPLDKDTLLAIGEEFRKKLAALTAEIYALVGYEFNIDSPKQVGTVLFDDLQLAEDKKRSTASDVLKGLVAKHPVVSKILEYRKYSKLISTYIDGLVTQIYPDGKLHAIFNQAMTTTGRLSSSEPNLQNISIRDEEGKLIRKAFFYPDPSLNILSFDYSQIELRILASLSGCPHLLDVFNHDEDIHASTAKHVFHVEGEVTSAQRRKAKAVNFGIVYGISDWGLADQLDISPKEAKAIIAAFYEAYPEVRDYLGAIVKNAEKDGYVATLLGRRRYLRELKDSNYQVREFAKRAAMNAPIQGTAADLIKIAMIHIAKALEEKHLKTKMVLQIHDELLFKVPDDEMAIVFPLVKELMEHAIALNVKLVAEGSYAKNWHEAK